MGLIKPYYEEPGITIYNADCREVLPQLEKVDLVLTDPPYGLGHKLHDGGTWATNPIYDDMLKWDKTTIENNLILSIIQKGNNAIVWGGHLYQLTISRCWLVWEKEKLPTLGDFEMAWTNFDMICKSMYKRRNPDGKRYHPTQKPLELMRWCISFCPDAKTVCDPFMGSGTTLRAAKDLGRKAIGIEISKEYCDIAVKRLQQEVFNLKEDKP